MSLGRLRLAGQFQRRRGPRAVRPPPVQKHEARGSATQPPQSHERRDTDIFFALVSPAAFCIVHTKRSTRKIEKCSYKEPDNQTAPISKYFRSLSVHDLFIYHCANNS